MSRARELVLAAAAELFAERGYRDVKIRDIAARAGLSPAMVIKSGGSKEELFHAVATVRPLEIPAVDDDSLGEALVRDVLDRLCADAVDPLARALMLRLTAPDPEPVRASFITGYLEPLAERLGGDAEARLRADLAVSALVGLAATLRILRIADTLTGLDEILQRYGAAVQRLLDNEVSQPVG